MEEIPPELVLNWDQTGIRIVPSNNWTMDQQGVKRVEVGGAHDKQLITAVFVDRWLVTSCLSRWSTRGKQHGAIPDSSFHQSGISPTHKSTGLTKPPIQREDHCLLQPDLQSIVNSTEHFYEFFQLVESVFLYLTQAKGRLEVVLSTPRIGVFVSQLETIHLLWLWLVHKDEHSWGKLYICKERLGQNAG